MIAKTESGSHFVNNAAARFSTVVANLANQSPKVNVLRLKIGVLWPQ